MDHIFDYWYTTVFILIMNFGMVHRSELYSEGPLLKK